MHFYVVEFKQFQICAGNSVLQGCNKFVCFRGLLHGRSPNAGYLQPVCRAIFSQVHSQEVRMTKSTKRRVGRPRGSPYADTDLPLLERMADRCISGIKVNKVARELANLAAGGGMEDSKRGRLGRAYKSQRRDLERKAYERNWRKVEQSFLQSLNDLRSITKSIELPTFDASAVFELQRAMEPHEARVFATIRLLEELPECRRLRKSLEELRSKMTIEHGSNFSPKN